jgi:4,5-dihydroxyphthalate decarboxylase
MPDLAQRLTKAFSAAKAAYRLAEDETPTGKTARANAAVVGDPFPFGVEPNRKALEAIVRYAVEQHVIPHAYKVEDLFVPGV